MADIDLIVDFMRQFYEFEQYPFDDQAASSALERLISDSALGHVWIISEDLTSIGYIVLTLGYSLEYHGNDAFIDEFYIQASHRGKGIGSKALKFVEERAQVLGVRALHLEVERRNKAGQGLYLKSGFENNDRYLMTKLLKS